MTDAAISPQLVMLENRAGRVVLHSNPLSTGDQK